MAKAVSMPAAFLSFTFQWLRRFWVSCLNVCGVSVAKAVFGFNVQKFKVQGII